MLTEKEQTVMYKILVVEDDSTIAEEMEHFLIKWGYGVEAVTDFSEVLTHFVRFSPQLVLMDIGLPFYNGYYWCGRIREISQVPIIFISSASDNMNIVMAVNMGGDDFITKPFELDVLAAKVQAILRRTYAFNTQAAIMEHQGILLNLSDMSLVYKNVKLELSKNEFRILHTLFEHAGETVTREAIMKKLWDDECFVDDNTLTVNMNRLRKKLESIGITELIATKKGVGYLLAGKGWKDTDEK